MRNVASARRAQRAYTVAWPVAWARPLLQRHSILARPEQPMTNRPLAAIALALGAATSPGSTASGPRK
jgi:hypothetical protein